MKLVRETEGRVTPSIARQVNHAMDQCYSMYRMLTEYANLGKPTVVIENGVRVTKCPPAYAGGVWPDRNVGTRGRR